MRRLMLTLIRGGGAAAPSLDAAYHPTSINGDAANFMFNTDGSASFLSDTITSTIPAQWLTSWPDIANASLYSVRRTQISGTTGVTFTGTMTSGVWFALTSQRGVTVIAGAGARQNVSTWDLALTADTSTVLATTTITVDSSP